MNKRYKNNKFFFIKQAQQNKAERKYSIYEDFRKLFEGKRIKKAEI